MAYYHPHIIGYVLCRPLCTLNNQGIFFHCSGHFLESFFGCHTVDGSEIWLNQLRWRISLYVYIPRTQLTSIFEGTQPLQNKAELPIKTRGPIWVLGIYIYIYIYLQGLKKNRCLAGFLSSTIGLLQFDRPYNSHEEPNGRLH